MPFTRRMVLKQYKGLFRGTPDKWTMCGLGRSHLRPSGVWVLEEAKGNFYTQHPADRLVHNAHRNLPVANQPGQLRVVEVRHHIDIDSGKNCLTRCRRGVQSDAVVLELHDRRVVADDKTVEPPFISQNVLQQKWIGRCRHTIERVKGA